MYTIRPLQQSDYSSVQRIYQAGIDTGQATFETQAPNWKEWDAKYLEQLRFVGEDAHGIVAWAALLPVSDRAVYRGVAEISIYVALDQQAKGIGSELMGHLITASERQGIWTIQANMFPENAASRRLHLRHGFREVGIRHKIAQQYGRWRDTLLMERRSELVF
ncbi:MAG: N-acetyltransferase family protein [Bacteroidota bacterium]